MADKQKIRNYACELLKDSQNGFGSASYNMLKMVIAYIDSLPEEPVSEELEEAAREFIEPYREVSECGLDYNIHPAKAFKAGAKWQKEQMMTKAIDGDITFDYYGDDDKTYGCIAHDSFCLEDFGLKDRDKVKVIVIKED